jgi:hypothetical protein
MERACSGTASDSTLKKSLSARQWLRLRFCSPHAFQMCVLDLKSPISNRLPVRTEPMPSGLETRDTADWKSALRLAVSVIV